MKGHTSTQRILQIIELLSKNNSVAIETIVKESKIPYTTVYRILHTFMQLGYVVQTSGKQFKLTQKLFCMSAQYLYEHCSLAEIAHPFLRSLYREVRETVHLGILDGNKILYVDKIESQYKIRMISYIGYQMDIYCTALGKVIFSYLSQEEQNEMLPSFVYTSHTKNTLTSKKAFLQEIETICTQGYAEDNEENEEHLYCIAVPIFNRLNQIEGAVSMSTFTFRFDKSKTQSFVEKLWKSAASISQEIGNKDYKACLFGTADN